MNRERSPRWLCFVVGLALGALFADVVPLRSRTAPPTDADRAKVLAETAETIRAAAQKHGIALPPDFPAPAK